MVGKPLRWQPNQQVAWCRPRVRLLSVTKRIKRGDLTMTESPALARANAFARANGLRIPILLAPMAGACPPSLSIAVAEAGGLGACGALSHAAG